MPKHLHTTMLLFIYFWPDVFSLLVPFKKKIFFAELRKSLLMWFVWSNLFPKLEKVKYFITYGDNAFIGHAGCKN